MKLVLALLACISIVVPAQGQEEAIAFVGARIIPIVGPEIERGTMIVEGGKITAVGPVDRVSIPEGATIHDLEGKTLMPGLICTHSHVGGISGGDSSSPIQPGVRVMDSIDVRDPGFQKARAGGLTTLNIMPGSGHLLSGQTIYVKLREGRVLEDLMLFDAEGKMMGGIKMANGTNSRREPPFPGTRAKSAALVREKYIHAQEYRDKIQRAGGDPEKMPARDLGLEALVEVLEKKRVVHHHTHRHDDILTVLRLREEFDFRVVLHHVSDGWIVAEEIAAAGVPCSVIVIDSPGGKLEAKDLSIETGAALERAGVVTGFHTDDGITDSRVFLRSAALAVRGGMSREGALRALTLAGAIMLDLQDRTGSLEVGKDADFTVLSGDPLSVSTRVLETWVEGEQVFDLADPEDRLYAEGGWGASDAQVFYGCCFDEEGR